MERTKTLGTRKNPTVLRIVVGVIITALALWAWSVATAPSEANAATHSVVAACDPGVPSYACGDGAAGQGIDGPYNPAAENHEFSPAERCAGAVAWGAGGGFWTGGAKGALVGGGGALLWQC